MLNLTIVNDLAEIERLAGVVETFCTENALDGELAHAFNLALDESLANTIHYGYDDTEPHNIDIRMAVDGDRVTATIEDDGRPYDPTEVSAPDIDADLDERPVGGLGIHFVRVMMDEVGYERVEGRNRLTLTKHIGD